MRFVPNAVSVRVARQALVLQKHSPAIMFGAGIAGGVTAAVLACKATLRVEEVLDTAEQRRAKADTQIAQAQVDASKGITPEPGEEYTLSDHAHDVRLIKAKLVRDLSKLYGPSVGLGLISIGLLTGAHVTLTRRNVALAAAYAAVDRAFKEYRERVVKEYGVEKDRELRYGAKHTEVVVEGEHGHEVKTVTRANPGVGRSQYAVLFDATNNNWQTRPEYNRLFVMNHQTFANQRLQAKGHLFLNDVYEAMGFPKTPEGQIVGWVVGGNGQTTAGDGYIDFGLFNPQTQEVIEFMEGEEGSVWLDFNVDGPVWDLI